MKKRSWLLFVLLLLLLAGCGAEKTAGETVVHEPPELTVLYGETRTQALRGTTTWTDETGLHQEGDAFHLLLWEELRTPVVLPPEGSLTARLEWDVMPDRIAVECWPEDCWGRTEVPGESVTVDQDGTLTLKDGGHIYCVTAEWDYLSRNWGGKVYYGFCIAAAK